MKTDIKEGAIFEIAYPFILEDFSYSDEEGTSAVKSWRPGIRYETYMGGPWYEPQTDSVADGMGKQIITVVSTHKPGRFPMRVFYTRRWETPAGKQFGKTGCHVKSITGFRNVIGGYRHEIDRVGAQSSRAA